jgi:hypothetical protein
LKNGERRAGACEFDLISSLMLQKGMKAHWFTTQEQGCFPIERAALGRCDLSVMHIAGEWQWLMRQDYRDLGEGAALSCEAAKLEAEAVAQRLVDPAP